MKTGHTQTSQITWSVVRAVLFAQQFSAIENLDKSSQLSISQTQISSRTTDITLN